MKIIYRIFNFIVNRKEQDIIIFDDILPSNLSPWRNYEYENLCKEFPNTYIYTDLTSYKGYTLNYSFDENNEHLVSHYPFLKNKIKKLKKTSNFRAKLGYTLFYNNVIRNIKYFERYSIPFVFTLYPGGGFELNNKEVNDNLKKIFDSDLFRGVIVNQYVIKEYLIANNLVEESKIKLIFGVSLNISNIGKETIHKNYDSIKILFFANKYSEKGKDKGFDKFQEIAKSLLNQNKNIEFIVIGNFNIKDLDFPELNDFFTFKGVLIESEYNKILEITHFIISPNAPFILNQGAFDGFPLSTCIAASNFDNVLIMSDYFSESQKINLIDGIDYIKFDSNIDEVANIILGLISDKSEMNKIATNGKQKIKALYSFESQIKPRIEFFNKILYDKRNKNIFT